jgi:L-fucose mutarotase
MLKGIPNIISPDLMKILMEMGHTDEIVIADGNFPGTDLAKRMVRYDGHNIPNLLDAILKFFPLDTYVEYPVSLMALVPGDPYKPTIWEKYKEIVKKNDSNFKDFEMVEKFKFYERTKKAFAVVATSESALYANIILKKGVVV